MTNAVYNIPPAYNEPVLNYAPGSPEKMALKAALAEARSKQMDIPMYIGQEVRTGNTSALRPPHDHQHILGMFHKGEKKHVQLAIDAALRAKKQWAEMPWEQRAAIFLKAADLLAGPYRYKMNAATMLGQSKNAYQAEIDSACEMIDFLRFNVQYMREIYTQQPPVVGKGVWNRTEQRPLEGFVFALTPFNFTAISGNLPTAPAMMGNTVVWKPANTQIYAANVVMQLLIEAGLPAGVINLVYVSGPDAGDVIFKHADFGGIHFTGSTEVFKGIWKTIGENMPLYKSYPRIVGETGGKDFIIAHKSADIDVLVTALARGAFEYQGQKCSAASRCYIPKSIFEEVKSKLVKEVKSMKLGPVEDFRNFVNAVIDEKSFDKISAYIENAKKSKSAEIIAGGNFDKSKGYFIEPTIILTSDAKYTTMCEEIFGPVLTMYVYEDDKFEETLHLVDNTSEYALTGAIISQDRYAVDVATRALVNSAGNFYINDKCTGAVVGQQPFGGARGSGTNDKAGAMVNLLRWVSPRTIKETFVPAKDYRYPFMEAE
ncbi:MAG TPA: L-glutamate gamma-semialdehyde dehydrogenase [Bacteroidia bacterium]|nr:L-glutamate gamma-semialdehyde dehydrogenase [Bacteroidia bacterium]